jgi:hypothetical protein
MGCSALIGPDHLLAWRESGVIACQFFPGAAPPNDRDAALRACGYTPPRTTTPVRFWPQPPKLNRPMMKGTPPTMNAEQLRAAQDRAVAAPADKQLQPHPGGLAGRFADATAESVEAMAIGDIDTAIGADMLAAAMAQTAISEPQSPSG